MKQLPERGASPRPLLSRRAVILHRRGPPLEIFDAVEHSYEDATCTLWRDSPVVPCIYI